MVLNPRLLGSRNEIQPDTGQTTWPSHSKWLIVVHRDKGEKPEQGMAIIIMHTINHCSHHCRPVTSLTAISKNKK